MNVVLVLGVQAVPTTRGRETSPETPTTGESLVVIPRPEDASKPAAASTTPAVSETLDAPHFGLRHLLKRAPISLPLEAINDLAWTGPIAKLHYLVFGEPLSSVRRSSQLDATASSVPEVESLEPRIGELPVGAFFPISWIVELGIWS